MKQFIVQRADDTGEHDEVRIALGRVSDLEYRAICDKLRGLSCVTRFEEGNGLSCVTRFEEGSGLSGDE